MGTAYEVNLYNELVESDFQHVAFFMMHLVAEMVREGTVITLMKHLQGNYKQIEGS